MVIVNIRKAKTRFSELLIAVEKKGEIVLICRNSKPIAEITPVRATRVRPKMNPDLKVTFAKGFDPAGPATEEDWPETNR